MPPDSQILAHAMAMAKALLIGVLIGAQREIMHAQEEDRQGIRDFTLIALAGGMCGLLDFPGLAVAGLIVVSIILLVSWTGQAPGRGITTPLAGIATYLLAAMATAQRESELSNLAVGLAIIATTLLAAKETLNQFLKEKFSTEEGLATLRFLALIFLIYPLLPEGSYGPYSFLAPRTIWKFVILVSAVSYFGYFLLKFLRPGQGLRLMAALGGIASTTASTVGFARLAADRPEQLRSWWQAGVIANTMQFPRVWAILLAVHPRLAQALLPMLLAMTLAGALNTLVLGFLAGRDQDSEQPKPGNPFAWGPALRFGLLFTIVMFLSRAGTAELGGEAIYLTALVGGSVDVDAVLLTVAELVLGTTIPLEAAVLASLLALAANAVFKSCVGLFAGSPAFAKRMVLSFALMFAAGFGVWAALGHY